MIESNVPPLTINSTKKHIKQTNPNPIIWDNALEDLLSQPISSNLESKKVSWKKITKVNAKSIPIDVKSAFIIENSNDDLNVNSTVIRPSSKIRNHELKSRELMIKNIIQTPITPRKKLPFPQTGSTIAKKGNKTCLYDRKELETIMYTRNQKHQPIAQQPMKKREYTNLTRTFDFHIPSSVRSTIRSRNSYFS